MAKTNERPGLNHAYRLGFFLLIAVYAAIFFSFSRKYPFYFIWDMDHITTVDSILIASGDIPGHVNHTNFGAYLIFRMTEKAAYALNSISVVSLDDLRHSLSPLFGVAELTDFFRRHSPVVVLLIPLFLWAAIEVVLEPAPFLSLICFLLLVTQDSLIYHSTMIRSELYSLFYWSAAVLACAFASTSTTRFRYVFCLVVAGLVLSLSYQTKLQAFFYVFMVPFVFWLFESFRPRSSPFEVGSSRIRLLSFASLAAFVLMVFMANRFSPPPGLASFADVYKINLSALVFGTVYSGVALASLFLGRLSKLRPQIVSTSILLAGFLLAFLLHLAMYPALKTSFVYLLTDIKMLFCRQLYQSASVYYYGGIISQCKALFMERPYLYLPWVLISSIVLIRTRKKTEAFSILALSLLILVNQALGIRVIARDLLWQELGLQFLVVLFLVRIFQNETSKLLRVGVGCLAAIVLVNNLYFSRQMPVIIDSVYNQYGWDEAHLFGGPYGAQAPYGIEMAKVYDSASLRKIGAESAGDYRERRETVNFVFQRQRLDQKNIGVVAREVPVWRDNRDYRISSYPPELGGKIIVDNSGIAPGNIYFRPAKVNSGSEDRDKILTSAGFASPRIVVLPRHDLDVYWFLPVDQKPRLLEGKFIPTGMQIELKNGTELLREQGFRLPDYAEIDPKAIGNHSFFVLANRLN